MANTKKNDVQFNPNKFIKGSEEESSHTLEITPVVKTETTKERKKREKATTPAVPTEYPVAQNSMSYIQQNIPYTQLFTDTNSQLDETINTLNILGSQVVTEMQTIGQSKTLRNKYPLFNEYAQTATTIATAKIAAIKEKNSTATQAARFELDRMKSIKSNANEEDDNTRIANLYNAFINTPVGVGHQLAPSMQDMILGGNTPAGPGFMSQSIGMDSTQAWQQSLDPAGQRMLLEAQGAIETVVMYDQSSGNRWYEVVDKNTRQPISGVEKPDNSTAYDLDINVRQGFAKDPNRGITYPLVVLQGNDTMNAY